MAKVRFHTADRRLQIPGKRQLKECIESIFAKEKRPLAAIGYIFCSDEYLLRMNREFLAHDYLTDIITFPLSPTNEPVEAEIYISIDRVKDNASELGQPYQSEILRVIFHGALHLCGYRDKMKSEIAVMRKKEDQYLRLFEKIKMNV